ncbi:hypothetical protein CERZMDRAFT_89768 [Cercospora zeae-maydis SCOH1-5]|uniref:Uncharacterized protein n=1 Tax=Cercospora zeae-maydis SCOH1-5 TaxID=717836 RepID=A0A6A6FV32_9PEZI|nr:hypothetical protein CERZMDRAFT_89768 [Cercospora zeae-maydis SCOH1-5]
MNADAIYDEDYDTIDAVSYGPPRTDAAEEQRSMPQLDVYGVPSAALRVAGQTGAQVHGRGICMLVEVRSFAQKAGDINLWALLGPIWNCRLLSRSWSTEKC